MRKRTKVRVIRTLNESSYAWPVIIVTLLVLLFGALEFHEQWNEYVVWAFTTLGAVMVSIIVLYVAERKLDKTRHKIVDVFDGSLQQIEKSIVQYISPSIVDKQTKSQMQDAMRKKLLDFIDSDEPDLYILGADQLAPTRLQLEELESMGEGLPETEKSARDYGHAYFKVFDPVGSKEVRRFIHLISEHEIVYRRGPFIPSYVGWLDGQINFLKTMKNYVLIDTPRAPIWGAPKSTILTSTVMAEVFFNVDGPSGGIIITSPAIAQFARNMLVNDYINKDGEAPKRVIYKQENCGELEAYRDRVKKALEEAGKLSG